ncbi:hypothetical protein BT69DRAFT_1090109 [Atractiella rhizophila]|nr:hypothetical protein BT69DRAFT_1090109 [Atractiella rhizophila]
MVQQQQQIPHGQAHGGNGNGFGNALASPSPMDVTAGSRAAFLKGPQSAAPYVPPIGHSHRLRGPVSAGAGSEEGGLFSAQGGGSWRSQKDRVLGRSNSMGLGLGEEEGSGNGGANGGGQSEEAYRTFQVLAKQQEEILWQIQQNREMIDRIQSTSSNNPSTLVNANQNANSNQNIPNSNNINLAAAASPILPNPSPIIPVQPPWMRNGPYGTQGMSPVMLQSPYPLLHRSP